MRKSGLARDEIEVVVVAVVAVVVIEVMTSDFFLLLIFLHEEHGPDHPLIVTLKKCFTGSVQERSCGFLVQHERRCNLTCV